LGDKAGNHKPISVLVVEDHEITRVGLRLMLEQAPDITIVGEAADGKKGVDAVAELKPNVVLMDIGLPAIDGIEATDQIKKNTPGVRVIMLTSHDNDRDVFAALSAGADGYCLKETPTQQLVLAIRAVADGAAWLDPGIASKVLRASVVGHGPNIAVSKDGKDGATLATKGGAGGPGNKAARLSHREIDVLKLVVEGMSNQAIAERLFVSVETVKTHMRRIMEKLAVSDRTQAAVKAMREGLL
jgi:NarL family two-component system response regulator LiaR